MIRYALVLAVAFIFACGCVPEETFLDKLQRVEIGMRKAQVEALLGKPDKVETAPEGNNVFNVLSIWPDDTSEIWRYESYSSTVYFDLKGRVNAVYGPTGQIKPPPPPIPQGKIDEYSYKYGPPRNMSEALECKAEIVAQNGPNYTVSFELKNITGRVVVIEPEPHKGLGPDREETVSVAVYVAGEWDLANSSMTPGEDWKGIVSIKAGETYERTIKFDVTEFHQAQIKAGARMALILYGCKSSSVTHGGKLVIPLERAGNAGQ